MQRFDARSFAAASTFPMKLLTNEKVLLAGLRDKKILPVHLQLNPTNRCNFDCGYCSCSSRKKSLELPLNKIMAFMTDFKKLGGESTTITGGGEPFAHDSIGLLINNILELEVKVGLVSNGTLWHRLQYYSKRFEEITWIRISSSDVLNQQLQRLGQTFGSWLHEQDRVVRAFPQVDWAFSHVVSKDPAYQDIADLIKFANEHDFTHVRLVSDILQAESLQGLMDTICLYLKEHDIDDSIVNYQDRAFYTKGTNPCYISLLKPVLAADGYMYPCCGTQYALAKPSKTYEWTMNMGSMNDFASLIKEQKFFDGSVCVKCYYSQYNDALGTLVNGISHKEFI